MTLSRGVNLDPTDSLHASHDSSDDPVVKSCWGDRQPRGEVFIQTVPTLTLTLTLTLNIVPHCNLKCNLSLSWVCFQVDWSLFEKIHVKNVDTGFERVNQDDPTTTTLFKPNGVYVMDSVRDGNGTATWRKRNNEADLAHWVTYNHEREPRWVLSAQAGDYPGEELIRIFSDGKVSPSPSPSPSPCHLICLFGR